MTNTVLLVGPFLVEISIAGRPEPLTIRNITGEGPENKSYASLLVMRSVSKHDPLGFMNVEDGGHLSLPLGDSQHDIPNGAVIVASSDDSNVKVDIGWE